MASAEELLKTIGNGLGGDEQQYLQDVVRQAQETIRRIDDDIQRHERSSKLRNINTTAIVEITAGVGGDEACLFAGQLYRMYEHYAKAKGLEIDNIDFSEGKVGGIKSVVFTIEGAYEALQYESGIHRVQRFSETATTDIMHTSAATVIVLPEIKKTDCIIKTQDVREDNFATGGPGGQNQNKSCTGVRLTHTPTEIVVSIRENKSQLRNRERAWQVLSARVADFYAAQVEQNTSETRRRLRGRGSRCERIRTYNYPQDRVTDHRINFTVHGIQKVLSGGLEPLIDKLQETAE